MASLLKQVAWSSIEEDRTCLRPIYAKIKLRDERPTRETMINLFIQCTQSMDIRVLFDALDECNKNEVGKIFHLIRTLRKANIGVYITTRPHIVGELRKRFPDSSDTLYMENIKADHTDVRNAIHRGIEDHGESIDPDFTNEIVSKIANSQEM